ncbi:MAG TPA: hypothetical protein VEC08_01500 [Nitrososphaerales archaeon]|nr:hypothetical protein [Nitrososphaerales archaeon]
MIDRNHFVKSVSDRVRSMASTLRSEDMAPLDFHNTLQRDIANLATEFGYRGVREYPVYGREEGVEGLADVAWIAKRQLVSVFEIDSAPKVKSVRKLLALDAPFRFWIYYGHQHYLSMVRSVDKIGTVEVIRLQNVYF